jgi:hypothetical protein
MTMDVHIVLKLVQCVLLDYSLLSSVDGRVLQGVWITVHSVKVESLSVIPPVTTGHPIRVQDWDNLEDIPL